MCPFHGRNFFAYLFLINLKPNQAHLWMNSGTGIKVVTTVIWQTILSNFGLVTTKV